MKKCRSQLEPITSVWVSGEWVGGGGGWGGGGWREWLRHFEVPIYDLSMETMATMFGT